MLTQGSREEPLFRAALDALGNHRNSVSRPPSDREHCLPVFARKAHALHADRRRHGAEDFSLGADNADAAGADGGIKTSRVIDGQAVAPRLRKLSRVRDGAVRLYVEGDDVVAVGGVEGPLVGAQLNTVRRAAASFRAAVPGMPAAGPESGR